MGYRNWQKSYNDHVDGKKIEALLGHEQLEHDQSALDEEDTPENNRERANKTTESQQIREQDQSSVNIRMIKLTTIRKQKHVTQKESV